MSIIAHVLAAVGGTTPASQPADAAPGWWKVLTGSPLLVLGGLFLLSTMIFGGKGKRGEEKARAEMLKNLKRGDRIQTIGGILGALVRAEEARVEVKVDESSNVKIWFARNAISKVVDAAADKADAK